MMGCRLLELHGELHPTSTIKIQKLSPQKHTQSCHLPAPIVQKKKRHFDASYFFFFGMKLLLYNSTE